MEESKTVSSPRWRGVLRIVKEYDSIMEYEENNTRGKKMHHIEKNFERCKISLLVLSEARCNRMDKEITEVWRLLLSSESESD